MLNPLSKEDLIAEILRNARRDRVRLETVADGLVNGFSLVPKPGEQSEQDFDPEVAAAFAEEISKIGDSLSKINHELVELVKLDRKSQPDDGPKKLGPDQVEDAYDEIQPQEIPN
jgi:hypothetical protein